MRAERLTLQAIADRLNRHRVPTLRSGSEWRPSSVQAVTGYKRPLKPPHSSLSLAPHSPETQKPFKGCSEATSGHQAEGGSTFAEIGASLTRGNR